MAGLHIKYRPDSLAKMLGNKEATAALATMLEKEDKPHVYLFVGPPGCGKTTAARAAAAMIGADADSIEEINASNQRGIDQAREIQDQMRHAPLFGEYRVWIIDEVHRTTKDWQNAMLKPLEDTPEHVFVFLCTTNPEQLLPAVKSRCQVFEFSTLSDKEAARLVHMVAKREGEVLDDDIISTIVESSEGHPRRLLTTLEKVLNAEGNEARIAVASSVSYESTEKEAIELARKLLDTKSNWAGVANILKGLPPADHESVRHMVLSYMNTILLSGKSNVRAAVCLDAFSKPFYDNPKAGLTLACWIVMQE